MLYSSAKKNLGLIFIPIWFLVMPAMAQMELNFTTLTTKNGISSNMVNAILQDHKGQMWFGTADGLNKYDGTNVKVYNHDEKDSTSLPANEVLALLEDRNGRLWVGTRGGGLVYYDVVHDSFVRYTVKEFKGIGEPPVVKALYQDRRGRIFAGGYGWILILEPEEGKSEFIDLNVLLTHRETSMAVLSFFEDNRGKIWMGTNNGLWSLKDGKFTAFIHDDSVPWSISGNIVRTIIQGNDGNLYFGTNNGLNKLREDQKSFTAFHHLDKHPNSIANDIVYIASKAQDGKLWLGTEDGLSIFDCKSFLFQNFKPNWRNSFSLKDKSIRSICMGKRGIIWLGSYQGGVNKYDPNLALFSLKHSTPFDPKGLSSSFVTSFAEYAPEKIFIGTDGGGLHLFHRNTGLFDQFPIRSQIDHSGNPLSIMTMAMDRNRKLWIGTYQNGLFKFNPSTGKYVQYIAGLGKQNLSQNDIFCIKEDQKGWIWIGTNGKGLNLLDPKTETFSRFNPPTDNPKAKSFLSNGYIRAIEEDREGNIWIGSNGAGIGVYNPNLRSFTLLNKSNSGLSDNVVISIFRDASNQIWVGTSGSGLNLFNKKTRKFIHFNELNGLANGMVYKILQDKMGNIWVSTDRGISSLDPNGRHVKNFGLPNGVQDSPFILGSGISTSLGDLYFGGQDGFNYFSPSALANNHFMPPVLLTELKVANNIVTPGQNSPINAQISMARDIHLSYGQNFSISYVALNFTAPQQNQYSYKLQGFDQDWNYVHQEKTAYYTHLDPGDYVFQVRASNTDGTWNDKATSVHILVQPPIWRTAYAYLLYFLMGFGLLFYIRHRGIQKIKNQLALKQEKINAQKKMEQERLEADRVHELDLQKIKFLTNLSHEFRTPISLILAPADKLMLTSQDPSLFGQVKMIRRNARRLLNLVNQLLDFRKMEEQELRLNLSPGDLIEVVRDAADSFQDLSDRKKISLIIESDISVLPAVFDHDKLERVIFNVLSNAFKFTPEGGEVRLKMGVRQENLSQPLTLFIEVSDTGIGIEPEHKNRIFERFFMTQSGSSILNQGSGIGLSIVKEFINLHGGEVSVENRPLQGTTFFLKLPVIEPQLEWDKENLDHSPMPKSTIAIIQNDKNPVVSGMDMATILLVEDNEEFRGYLKDSLQPDYHIIEATNGKEGWQKALSGHPHLVVSDISMPCMNGIELSHKIKSDIRTSHIPIILLTAMSGEENQIKGLESGANDYLTKPFNFEIFNAKIKNQLHYNRSLKDAYSKHIQVSGKEIEIESTDAKLLNMIVQHIEDKLNDPELSVEELSRHVGMSRGSLYHKLLVVTGLTPIEYIRTVKLDRAATLLEKSDYNVAQIAYMTGFGTPSYFSRLFKAKFNVLPSEYIGSMRKENKVFSEPMAN